MNPRFLLMQQLTSEISGHQTQHLCQATPSILIRHYGISGRGLQLKEINGRKAGQIIGQFINWTSGHNSLQPEHMVSPK